MEVDMQRLKMFTECAICLDAFDNPKQLRCNHTFCKTCLEEILLFQEDGSATITCPMKCDVQTLISAQETVNQLPVSYEFKSILEVLRTRTADVDVDLKCECSDACASGVSIYCCGSLMCKGCFNAHENSTNEPHLKKRKIGFNRKEGKMKVLCSEHSTYCSDLCVDGDFLCMYCLARNDDHKRRHKNNIETEVALIREALNTDMKRNCSIMEFQETTENSIDEMRDQLMTLLEQRRKECIAQYVEFIGKEMELLKNRFERICNDHFQQYPDNLDVRYHEKKLLQNDVVLAIEKDDILNTILENRNETTLHTETVSFSKDTNFLSAHPLGDIKISYGEAVVIDKMPLSTLISDLKKTPKTKNLSTSSSDTLVGQYRQLDKKNAVEGSGTILRASSSQSSCNPRQLEISASSRQVSGTKTSRQAYLDIGIGNEIAGRIIIDLFFDEVPKTCKHFVQLCTHSQGCGYKGSKFCNISPWNGYCEGGDIAPSAGNIPCENYYLEHNCKGVLSMAKCNDFVVSSKFFITSKAKPEWNGSHVVFGRVTKGTYNVVEKMMKVKTFGAFFGGMPLTDVVIKDSGVL